MRQIRSMMGMPITIEIKDREASSVDFDEVFDYLKYVDEKYSPFKETSEVGKLNRGEKVSDEMDDILKLADKTKRETNGYFDIKKPNGKIDPSGIVKGWAIRNAADILRKKGYKKFFVDAGGDAEIVGKNWKWGIRNPFNIKEIVKVLKLSDCGIATSGTYERGQHIYDPVSGRNTITSIVSLTVIGPNVYEADRFATPAFAMGRDGINFIEKQKELEGYMIDDRIQDSSEQVFTSELNPDMSSLRKRRHKDGIATMTSGFKKYEMGR